MIMAGDHKQLGVSVRSRAAGQLELSLMERLISLPHYSAQLEDQSQDTSTNSYTRNRTLCFILQLLRVLSDMLIRMRTRHRRRAVRCEAPQQLSKPRGYTQDFLRAVLRRCVPSIAYTIFISQSLYILLSCIRLLYTGELRACANPIETKSLCAWELLRSPQDDGETEYFDEEDARCPVMFFGQIATN